MMRHTHSRPPETNGVLYMRRHLRLGHDIDAPESIPLGELVECHGTTHVGAFDVTEELEPVAAIM